jgi:leucyl-tRNA synthetase
MPIWIADYVLISYGTGAIMAVPAHDTRDFEFAAAFDLPIVAVVDPGEAAGVWTRAVLAGREACFVARVGGQLRPYDGLDHGRVQDSGSPTIWRAGLGRAAVNYKLRDWLFSRQRFWGEPFPILHELDEQGSRRAAAGPGCRGPAGRSAASGRLPAARPPRAAAGESARRLAVRDPRRPSVPRETNTMPQWAGSCWYYLRFIDPRNDQALVDPGKERAWMPVDLYVGGAEHAVLHLLYARFWHKVLFDRGYVSTSEPFQRLVNQGMILGEMEYTGYRTADGRWVSADVVAATMPKATGRRGDGPSRSGRSRSTPTTSRSRARTSCCGRPVDPRRQPRVQDVQEPRQRGQPRRVVRDYGADALRLYEMFMGPLEATKPWSMAGVNGVRVPGPRLADDRRRPQRDRS